MNRPARVLLLEDSDIDAELICAHLERSQVRLDVVRAVRRSDFEAALQRTDIDLVLSDYSMPDFDGMEALRLTRERLPDRPFVFISGVVGEDIATEALRQGATDYVLKRSLSRLPKAVERALAETRERAQRQKAEAALGASEANTQLAVAAAQLGMWHYAPGSRALSCDGRCQRMFGVSDSPLMAHDVFLSHVHPDHRQGIEAAFEAAMANGSNGQLLHELRAVAPDGSDRWLVMRGQAMFDRAGRCTQVLGMLQDVTAQKLAEARQRQTEVLFRLAAEAADIGVWNLEIEHNELWFDDGLRAIADLPPGEILDYRQMLEQVVHPDDRPMIEATLHAATLPGAKPEVEYEHRMIGLRDRKLRWVAVKGRRVDTADGRQRLVGTVRDVTEQRRKDQALRRMNEALGERVEQRTRERDRIWNLSVDLMCVCRYDSTLLAMNPAWERLLGWHGEDLLEAKLLDFIHRDDKHSTLHDTRLLEQGASTVRFDNRVRRRDGSYRWIRWTASPDDGLFYAIGRDVTEERAAADALAASNRQLKEQIEERGRVEATLQQMQRLEAVGQLTSGVAHDFNNLLTVVLSNISLIRRLLKQGGAADERVVQRLEAMKSAAERGAKLTAQMLAFSRRQRLEPQVIDLNDTVMALRDLLQTTMGGSVRLNMALARPLWPALVDVTQMELIVLNLAINARDAMEVGGSLTLRTSNLTLGAPERPEEPEPGDYVALTVSDTGSGMPPEVLAKAFEPFFTTKEVGKGSGLGLAQVFGFAKQSGGGVRIDTQPGAGTSVHVFMPRAQTDVVPEAESPNEADALDGTMADHTLLLVDDDPAVREATSAMLRAIGYRVVEASSGGHALELAARRKDIDLVLADFAMPGMNGAELVRLLKQSHPGLRALFLTGFVDLAALKDVPEEYVLQKPLSDEVLAQRLQRVLRAPRSPRVVSGG